MWREAELCSAPSGFGGARTQADLSKASCSGRVRSREVLVALFIIILPRQSFPPVGAGGGSGVLTYPSTCEASTE